MFGSDGSPIVQYVSIFAVIFAVLAVIVLGVRRLRGDGPAQLGRNGQRGRQPRLGIVDVYELDRQRQLVLLRRDNVEHLLLLGGPNDVVIERNIQRGAREAAPRTEAPAEPVAAELPGGAVPGPDARRTEPAFGPEFAMPVVLPPPVPGSRTAPPVAVVPPLDAAALDAADAADEPADGANESGPRAEPVVRRPMRRTAPPLINPRPDVASERPRPEMPAFGPGPIPPLAPAERRAVDPAILSDMARQLEAALARPASAVTPPPAPPSADAPGASIDPVAAAMAGTAPPAAHPDASDAAPFAEPVPEPVVVPVVVPAAPEPPAEPPAPAMPPAGVPQAADVPASPPEPVAPPPAPAPPPPKPAANPFSVEEIEAEFARLLGRPLDKRN